MTIAGPTPSEDRIRRNAPTFNDTKIIADGKLRGPRLPKGDDYEWCDRTREWWESWRRSPQAMVMVDTDWEFMLETALLHNQLWGGISRGGKRNGSVSDVQLSAEIRQRVSKMGATFEDRLKLRMSITTPQSEADKEARLKAEAEEGFNYFEALNKAIAPKD